MSNTRSMKQKLGQFNTTKKEYILSGMEDFVEGKSWIDPYAGNGDLLDWVKSNGATSICGYDVDPSKVSSVIEHRDTLLNPPSFDAKYVIANPPYLARNKCKNKILYEKYDQDDLYKIALLTINGCDGGVFIVPLNFLSSIYANSIRDIFFKNYKIKYCKIFEESVFEDTDYTVCAFCFERRCKEADEDKIKIKFYPSGEDMSFKITKKYHWIIGEEFYQYIDKVNHAGIGRWTEKDMRSSSYHNEEEREEKQKKDGRCRQRGTIFVNDFNRPEANSYFYTEALDDIILIRSMDTGTMDGRIGLSDIRESVPNPSLQQPVLLGLETSRNKAHVRFDSKKFKDRPSIEEQLKIISIVNNKLESFRKEYNSVFMTAFRNSTEAYSRKRISFDVLYKMIACALSEIRNS